MAYRPIRRWACHPRACEGRRHARGPAQRCLLVCGVVKARPAIDIAGDADVAASWLAIGGNNPCQQPQLKNLASFALPHCSATGRLEPRSHALRFHMSSSNGLAPLVRSLHGGARLRPCCGGFFLFIDGYERRAIPVTSNVECNPRRTALRSEYRRDVHCRNGNKRCSP